MDDILAKMAAEADDGPSDKQLSRLMELSATLVERRRTAEQLEARLKETNKEIWELEMKTIPDFAQEIGVDRVGLPDYDVDIIVEPYYKANISSDWDDDRKASAFDHLRELHVDDIIRTRVEYSLGKDSLELAHEIAEAVQSVIASRGINDVPTPSIGMSVPWNTLTSTVKDLSQKGVAMDLERIGATVGQRAKIKERKS